MSTNNEVIIIAEESTGETTVVEIIATDSETLLAKDADGETLVGEIVEAVFDHLDETDDGDALGEDSDATDAEVVASFDDVTEMNETASVLGSADVFDATIADYNTPADLGSAFDVAAPASFDAVVMDETGTDFTTFDAGAGVVDETSSATEARESATENIDSEVDADAQANFDLATEAQAKADEAVAAGDYEAASAFREDAEDAAWQAGDDSMLHGSDANDLMMADTYQDKAEYLEEQQAEYAQAGDYEAARDASRDAATYTQWADIDGGGADHSAEAANEYQQMDMAAWEQDTANYYQENAEAYAAQGDFENAEVYQGEASEHQDTADYYGDLGEHNGTYDQFDEVPDASYGVYDYSTDYASTDYSSSDYSSSYASYDSSSDTE